MSITVEKRETSPTVDNNPANPLNTQAQERARRIPMSTSLPKFQVDPIPGYHLHWFAEDRVARAKQAGYELVRPKECLLNGRSIGTSQGNTDLGDCVSIVGSPGDGVKRAVLMKLKEEWWLEDKAAIDARNARIAGTIFGGEAAGVRVDDQGNMTTISLPEGAYVGNRSRGMDKPVLNRGVKKQQRPRI